MSYKGVKKQLTGPRKDWGDWRRKRDHAITTPRRPKYVELLEKLNAASRAQQPA